MNKLNHKTLYFFISLFLLPFLLVAVKKIIELRKTALGRLANITVDLNQTGQPINPNLWQNFTQGGEERNEMIKPALPWLTPLQPKFIRIDHLYDYYEVLKSDGSFDFSKLDRVVVSILQTGATPMLSLSYIPPQMTQDKNITSPPINWSLWQNLVKVTIKHYSGKNDLNINNVYYEVFNEPDLFGQWHYHKSPNYLKLYYYSAKAAQEIQPECQPFKIGGPATTGFYPNWVKALLKFASEQKLRLDFISWHQYSLLPQDYVQDLEAFNQILTDYPEWLAIERIISEFGPETQKSIWYQNNIGAAHDLAVITQVMDRVHKVFAFEIKDGPDDNQGWGLLTHQAKGGIRAKPRWLAYQFLNQLTGTRTFLTGEGSWVYGIASQDKSLVMIMLVNYDPENKHFESPPIKVFPLSPGKYKINLDYLFGQDTRLTGNTTDNSLFFRVALEPNEAVIISIEPL